MLLTKNVGGCIFEVYNERPNLSVKQVHQVHGNLILDCISANNELEADGIICLCFKCTLAIKTADCLPIAVCGERGFALLHAGWRGLSLEIIKQEILSKILPHTFFIGPHIKQNAYEVGEDFFKNFPDELPIMIEGRFHFSLQEIAIKQILDKYPQAKIECSDICTFEDFSYNSYRRNKTTLRNWNLLKKGSTHE